MRSFNRNNWKKTTASIVASTMLVLVLLSALFIVIETEHHCTGEECPICSCILQCENSLHYWDNGGALQAALFIPVILSCIYLPVYTLVLSTPVSRKVRLNN